MAESSSSALSRRARAIRQCAIVSGHESEAIPFSPLLFASQCRRYLEELVLGSGPSDIAIDSAFQRDSVVQFVAACQGDDFALTLSNAFEVELLCDQWSVLSKSIRKRIAGFIEQKGLWLRRLLFRLGRGFATAEAEELLRSNLVGLVSDYAALENPAAVMARIVDFRDYEARSDECERLFTFCIDYFRAHGSGASQIFRTLPVTGLSNEHLDRLCALENLNWGVLGGSVRSAMIELGRERIHNGELRSQVAEQQREMRDLRNEV
jgi:hypothetical protein